MRERPTRLIAFVVLLLTAALMHLGGGGATYAASQRRANQKIFMPAILQRPAAIQDLTITHLGLFQSVQTATNSVSLIAGKPALLRVFAQSVGASTPAVAEVTVHAQRGATDLGSLTLGPEVVFAQPNAGDLSSTFNFDLPQEWLSGEVTLTATIDAVNTVPEADEANNTHVAQFSFLTVAPLRLTIIPISYHDTRTGQEFLDAPHDPISDWLRGTFPVSQIDVVYHPPFTFSGDLRQPSEWQRLLDGLTTLWAAEVGFGSPTVYYGLIPSVNASGATWFEGGVSGLGWIGQRVSLGLDVGAATGNSAGHELGHNFGRRHAPCGNPSSVDPHYPYPNATIGVYGVDTEEEVVLAPAANFDMMSYCGPEWVSDYTYEALLSDQLARAGQSGAPSDGLLLRATLENNAGATPATGDLAAVEIAPIYRLSSALLPAGGGVANSDYTAQLLDATGAVIATQPVALLEAVETGVEARLLVAHMPLPETEVAAVRFVRDGRVVAERSLGGPDAAGSIAPQAVPTAAGLTLRWGRADVPALVRVSADGVQWTTLAVDATGGQLTLLREQLPAGGRIQIVAGDGRPAMMLDVE